MAESRRFKRRLLDDVNALETMIREQKIERGITRIGAEQELVLVKNAYRTAPVNLEVIEAMGAPEYATTELARFNVELNLDPFELKTDCFRQMENQLVERVEEVREGAAKLGTEVVMCGILPTLRLDDLGADNMTPKDRYRAMEQALNSLRGNAWELKIQGPDELIFKHDSVMLESANTSFQVHLQVEPETFANFYNAAQLVTAPVMAAAVNSPIMFGRRLWEETRIAVFQQSVDTRSSRYFLDEHSSRVHFGRSWLKRSVVELFQEDIARFPVILPDLTQTEEAFEALAEGRAPNLGALLLHNSTVYRWNRPCYGVSGGVPHLRIENRVLPGGPSAVDAVANAAFWIGLMQGVTAEHGDVSGLLPFEACRGNFLAAARTGLGSQFQWLDGRLVPSKLLILNELLPLARRGLEAKGVVADDIERYLGTIEARVESEQTGAAWQLKSLENMRGKGTQSQQLCALTQAMIEQQSTGRPVHEWPLARMTRGVASVKQAYAKVEQLMTTDVITVDQEELVDVVARIMEWQNLRYLPVVNEEGRLKGLVSQRGLLRFFGRALAEGRREVPVKEIMHTPKGELVCAGPKTSAIDAMNLMSRKRIGCLPVVEDGQLVGMITESSFIPIARQLLEAKLSESEVGDVADDD